MARLFAVSLMRGISSKELFWGKWISVESPTREWILMKYNEIIYIHTKHYSRPPLATASKKMWSWKFVLSLQLQTRKSHKLSIPPWPVAIRFPEQGTLKNFLPTYKAKPKSANFASTAEGHCKIHSVHRPSCIDSWDSLWIGFEVKRYLKWIWHVHDFTQSVHISTVITPVTSRKQLPICEVKFVKQAEFVWRQTNMPVMRCLLRPSKNR
jgi:hypothetical protein